MDATDGRDALACHLHGFTWLREKDKAYLSYELATIKCDLELPESIEQLTRINLH